MEGTCMVGVASNKIQFMMTQETCPLAGCLKNPGTGSTLFPGCITASVLINFMPRGDMAACNIVLKNMMPLWCVSAHLSRVMFLIYAKCLFSPAPIFRCKHECFQIRPLGFAFGTWEGRGGMGIWSEQHGARDSKSPWQYGAFSRFHSWNAHSWNAHLHEWSSPTCQNNTTVI